jgi:PAS domain S-box-containing protein
VIVYDASTFAVLDANQAAMQCYGYSRDSFLEMNVERLVTPDLSGEWLMYAVTRKADSAQRGIWKHITGDGRVLSVDVHSHKMSWAGIEARMMLIVDLTDRIRIEREREELIERLQHALAEVRTLSGLLPICAWCKKVRDDQGYYHQIEHYISQRSDATFSHGICPEFNREVEERRQKSAAAADH